MSRTYIALNEALGDPKRRPLLAKRLKEGSISAYAPMVYSGLLIEKHVAENFDEIISEIYQSEIYKRVAIRHLSTQQSHVKYLWHEPSKTYFAIFQDVPSGVATYVGEDLKPDGRSEIPQSFWRSAYIDGPRCCVVYDDWQGLWRTEYMRVQIDNKVVEAIDRSIAINPLQVGRPSLASHDIEQYAIDLMVEDPGIILNEFIKNIMAKFVNAAGSYNTVDKHYGYIWRERACRRSARPQKPK